MPILNDHGYPANTKQLRTMLGLNPGKLPKEVGGTWEVQGYRVILMHQQAAQITERPVRRPHRLFVKCKSCGNWFGAGRQAQHEKSCSGA
jgi:hypothetical protein